MKMPFQPMLAKKGDAIPRGGDWAFELKWDGIRAIIKTTDTTTRIWTRKGREVTPQFPELCKPLRDALGTGVWDAEIIVTGKDGKPSFPLATGRLHLGNEVAILGAGLATPATAMIFDCLEAGSERWADEFWYLRREVLEEIIEESPRVKLSPVSDDGEALMKLARQQDLEGIMAKNRHGLYHEGKRRKDWTKVKCQCIEDVYVVGYTDGQGKRDGVFGALLLQDKDGNDAGRVGTGFTDAQLAEYWVLLRAVGVRSTTTKGSEQLHWLKRKLPAEVKAMYRTPDGSYREPVFREFK